MNELTNSAQECSKAKLVTKWEAEPLDVPVAAAAGGDGPLLGTIIGVIILALA